MQLRKDLTGCSPFTKTLQRWFVPMVVLDVFMFALLASLAGLIPVEYAYEAPKMNIQASNIQDNALPNYYKSLLNERESEVYDNVERAFRSYNYVVDVPDGTTDEEAAHAIDAVLFDNPDIFWGETDFRYHHEIWGLSNVTLKYIHGDIDKIKEMKKRYDDIADAVIEQAMSQSEGASDEETARFLYAWIIHNTKYKESTDSTDQNISSVFDDRESVCAGYSKAMKFLCDKAGIPCLYVTGNSYETDVEGEYTNHAWNVLELDGRTCYIDATWGDRGDKAGTGVGLDVSWYWFDTDYDVFKNEHVADMGEHLEHPMWEDTGRTK